MSRNAQLNAAKRAKNDEFYTQYTDIERELNAYIEYNPNVFNDKTILLPCDNPEVSNFTKYFVANFNRLGLKKLISTSYAKESDKTLFEQCSDNTTHEARGKIFILERDTNKSNYVNQDDIGFSGYLEGDGDFRSEEVTALRDEADVIITNPPFSLFREFITWIINGGGEKHFLVMGNMNAIIYQEVFPYMLSNKLWIGYNTSGSMRFTIPEEHVNIVNNLIKDKDGSTYASFGNIRWFTNMDHGKRHTELLLDTMRNNLKFNKQLRKRFEAILGEIVYPKYDNYDAIEVPFLDAIPSDYKGAMGVPVTYMDKHNPEQFDIVDKINSPTINGTSIYKRIIIKRKSE